MRFRNPTLLFLIAVALAHGADPLEQAAVRASAEYAERLKTATAELVATRARVDAARAPIAEATRAERSTPGLMCYRRDRWAGLSTTNGTGAVVTRTLRAPGAELAINAATRTGGQVLVEVIDAAGKPLGGYCGENAAVFAGDETRAPLRWSRGKQTRLPDEPFALSVRLRDAELFALAFSEPTRTQTTKE